MDSYWSKYVQKSEELYLSRSLKFHKDNIANWVDAMQINDGMKILEVGCAGGLLCHQIKKYLQNVSITGIDLDAGHIEYANRKTEELNLQCEFVVGDATKLPFGENTFDVCYSHTVINFCDPELFVGEQYRVLKPGGRIIIMCVEGAGQRPEEWIPTDDGKEKELFDKIWAAASQNTYSKIKRYENRTEKYFEYLSKKGFKNLSIDAVAIVKYAPDCDNVSHEMALAQINEDRLSEISSVEKAHVMAPNALTISEYQMLLDLIHKRYDAQIERYEKGDKNWEYRIVTTVLISGTK